MKSKERLEELGVITESIKAKRMMAETYRQLAEGMSSPKITDMPKNNSSLSDPMAETLMKAIELEQEATELEAELLQKKTDLMNLIQKIDSAKQTVLLKRYFKNLTIQEIAKEMYCSVRWVHKLRQEAFKELDELQKSSL